VSDTVRFFLFLLHGFRASIYAIRDALQNENVHVLGHSQVRYIWYCTVTLSVIPTSLFPLSVTPLSLILSSLNPLTVISTQPISRILIQFLSFSIPFHPSLLHSSLFSFFLQFNLPSLSPIQWVWHPSELNVPYKFLHFYRHPFKKIVSGYR
jgi:hypothetical protein